MAGVLLRTVPPDWGPVPLTNTANVRMEVGATGGRQAWGLAA